VSEGDLIREIELHPVPRSVVNQGLAPGMGKGKDARVGKG
jgi:hypothetical protein